jgi:gliding motility-associated-like protein
VLLKPTGFSRNNRLFDYFMKVLVFISFFCFSFTIYSQSNIVYFNDFQNSVGPGWSNLNTYSFNNTTVLGPFGNQTVNFGLSNLPINDTVKIVFELFIHDSWDGHSDKWELKFEQNNVTQDSFLTDFNNHSGLQSYPSTHPANNPAKSGSIQLNLPRRCISSTSSSSWSTTKYLISKSFYSVHSSGIISFKSYQSSNSCDESWGIDNVSISHSISNFGEVRDTVICSGDSVKLSSNLKLQSGCLSNITYTGIPYGDPIPGFTYKGLYNGHYYYVYNTPTSWIEGERICRKNGGYMVCIDSANENSFISNLVTSNSNRNIWIGFFRDSLTCQFRWLNCVNISYTNWRPGEPNSNPCGEPYAQIIRGCSFGLNTWNNLDNISSNGACYSNMVPILEIDPTLAPQARILWSTGDTTESITVAPSQTTVYWVQKTLNLTTTIDTVIVGVLKPVISASKSIICSGDSTNLITHDSSTFSINSVVQTLWSTGDTASAIIVNPTHNTTYWVAKTLNNTTCYDSISIEVLESVRIHDTVTTCDSYTWIDGITYTTSTNLPRFVVPLSNGCDSVVSLALTINSSNSSVDSITSCDSFTWINGNTYTASTNTPTYLLTSVSGCDSLVTLYLTINHSTAAIDSIVACDSYTWIDGNTYTGSTNLPTYLMTSTNGCDSLIRLKLTINHSTVDVDSVVSCGSFTWIDGNTYTSSTNTPSFLMTGPNGCDRFVLLDLTINNSTSTIDSVVSCDNYTWIDGNTYTTSTNLPTFILTRSNGCDSVVSLALTINFSISSVDTITACDHFTWINGNTYSLSTSTPTNLLTRRNGCDSLVSLYLTINNSTNTINSDTTAGAYYWNFTRMYYLNSGTYYFNGTSVYGCDSLAQINLTIIPYNTFYFANSFTPNNDGINDKYIPTFNNAKAIYFTVTNRWGNVIFQTNDVLSEGWDGTLNDIPQPLSTYTWRFEIDYNNGEKIVKTGLVNLIR